MNTLCFNHKGTHATKKCGCCVKPLCDDCALTFEGVAICSEKCLERIRAEAEKAALQAQAEAERAAAQAQADAAKAALAFDEELAMDDLDQTVTAYKIFGWVATGCIIFFGWDYFPTFITGNIEMIFNKVLSSF